MAKKVRASMSPDQMHDFAVGPEADKPEHVFKGASPSAIHLNRKGFKARGQSETDATKAAIQVSQKGSHPANNLKHFLHPKKSK